MKSLRACSASLVVSVAVDCCKHQASLSGTIWRERIRVKFLREAASGSEVSRAPVRANLISQRARERTNAHRSRKKHKPTTCSLGTDTPVWPPSCSRSRAQTGASTSPKRCGAKSLSAQTAEKNLRRRQDLNAFDTRTQSNARYIIFVGVGRRFTRRLARRF